MADRYLEYMPIDAIQPAPSNSKRHALDVIGESVGRFGVIETIHLDERTGRIIAGHGRLETLQNARAGEDPVPDGIRIEDGVWLAPVVRGWASKDDDEAVAAGIALNRGVELGGWDQSALLDDLQRLNEIDGGLVGVGYEPTDITAMLESIRAADATPGLVEPDHVPPVPSVPFSRDGDIWLLGPHRLAVGDSRDQAVAERAAGGRPVDLVVTDPPYGVDYIGKTQSAMQIQNDDLTSEKLTTLLRSSFGAAIALCRPGAAWYVAAPGGPPASEAFHVVLSELGVWRQTIVWVKDRFVLGRSDYHWRHEDVLYGHVPGGEPDALPDVEEPDEDDLLDPAVYVERHETVVYGWKPDGAHRRLRDRRQDTVWEIPRPSASREHPTMKPVELFERAIRNSSPLGALVLDPFTGSGTTMIAAHRSGRVAALIELDRIYADVICARWQAYTGLQPIRESTGEPHDFLAELVALPD